MVNEFAKDIWIVEGASVTVFGFHYPTRMAVIRLANKSLFIWSPIALTEGFKSKIDKLGEVAHIVAPNSLHHLFLQEWQNSYPNAKLHAPPQLKEKRTDISFYAFLEEDPAKAWENDIDQVIVSGNLITSEVVFFHKPSCTVLFADLLQQFPAGWHKGWRGIIARLDLMVEPKPSVPRKFRLAFTNRDVARLAVNQIVTWPTQKVLMAHGTPIEKDGQEFIANAFKWLLK